MGACTFSQNNNIKNIDFDTITMSSPLERRIIVEYWFRASFGSDIAIPNIVAIAVKFSTIYEKFAYDSELSNKALQCDHDGRRISKIYLNSNDCNTFGTAIAKPGNSYHWTIKVVAITGSTLNIGIMEADKCDEYLNGGAWYATAKSKAYGYSYFAGTGEIYHVTYDSYKYGDRYGAGDIIHVWLDLRDNKNELFFGKNDKKYGRAANVKASTEYKLAIAMCGNTKTIELLAFDAI